MLLNPSIVVYGDSQSQNPEPIPEQSPIPRGSHSMRMSWDREEGYMKVVIGDATWYFKELLGKAVVIGTDADVGRIYLDGTASINGETLTLGRPANAEPHRIVEGEELDNTYNRCCYFRDQKRWRLRDEKKTAEHHAYNVTHNLTRYDVGWKDLESPDLIRYVKSYTGDGWLSWTASDPYAHIYHQGWTVIDEDNVAHLYDPDEVYI